VLWRFGCVTLYWNKTVKGVRIVTLITASEHSVVKTASWAAAQKVVRVSSGNMPIALLLWIVALFLLEPVHTLVAAGKRQPFASSLKAGNALKNDLLIRAARGEQVERTPVIG
jgi:hypothetical protein